MAKSRANTQPSRHEQRRKASLSRPGSKAEPAVEALRRERGYKIGSYLSLEFLRMMKARVKRSRMAEAAITEILQGKRAGGAAEITALAALQMTNMDLVAFNRDVQDRFGALRRTQTDVTLAQARPAVLVVEGGLGWPAREGGTDAEVVVRVADGGAAAGGHGDPVH